MHLKRIGLAICFMVLVPFIAVAVSGCHHHRHARHAKAGAASERPAEPASESAPARPFEVASH